MSRETPDRILSYFPGLADAGYRVTSPQDPAYNCIAWAARDTARWWEPDSMNIYYWPDGVARILTIEAFVRAYGTLGFLPCETLGLEVGFEKVALFAKAGVPTHAARQLPDGRWTSKLGEWEDIEHELQGVAGGSYGDVVQVLRRATSPYYSS